MVWKWCLGRIRILWTRIIRNSWVFCVNAFFFSAFSFSVLFVTTFSHLLRNLNSLFVANRWQRNGRGHQVVDWNITPSGKVTISYRKNDFFLLHSISFCCSLDVMVTKLIGSFISRSVTASVDKSLNSISWASSS